MLLLLAELVHDHHCVHSHEKTDPVLLVCSHQLVNNLGARVPSGTYMSAVTPVVHVVMYAHGADSGSVAV